MEAASLLLTLRMVNELATTKQSGIAVRRRITNIGYAVSGLPKRNWKM